MPIRIRRLLYALAALAILAPGALWLSLHRYAAEPRVLSAPTRVTVPAGASASRIADLLSRAGLAPSALGNLWAERLWGRGRAVKAGVYRFEGTVTLARVLDDLYAGKIELVTVTLPEGLTAREMAPLLEAAGVTDGKAFAALAYDAASPARWGVPGPTLEGYLFPDTYYFARGVPPDAAVTALVNRFKAVSGQLAKDSGPSRFELRQWVTLASVVEKETGRGAERPLIASVFLNRLNKRMRLESDPTVIYGLKVFDGNLRKNDLTRDTPYNTYTRFGLPPGPIANPGKESLAAVLRPAATGYLYFVSRNDGSHQFSQTYGEHVAAVNRYQKKRP